MREAIYSLAVDELSRDKRIRACWLSGPMANHIVSPYQEVVMSVAVEAESYSDYVSGLKEQVERIHPTIGVRLTPVTRETGVPVTISAVFRGGVLFELTVHRVDHLEPQPGPAVMLFKRDCELELIAPHVDVGTLMDTIKDFWMTVLQGVEELAREEPWAALNSIQLARNKLWFCWKLGHGSPAPERLSLVDAPAPGDDLLLPLEETIPLSKEESDLARALDALIDVGHAELAKIAKMNSLDSSDELPETVKKVFVAECGHMTG